MSEPRRKKNKFFKNCFSYFLFFCNSKAININQLHSRTLSNCSASISAACAVPNNTANFTVLDTCKDKYDEIKTKNAACLKLTTDGDAACKCWEEAANMTAAAKKLTDDCDSKTTQLEMKSLKKDCLAAFGKCKKAEDSSVAYIMTCSQDSSSASSSSLNVTATSTSSSNSSSLRRGKRSWVEESSLLGGFPGLTSL